MPGEKTYLAVQFVLRDPIGVLPRVRVQRLVRRTQRLEQGQALLPRNPLVVPLDQELDRHGDPRRDLGVGHGPGEPEHRGADPGVGGHERNPEPTAQRHTPVADRPGTDPRLHVVDDGLPLGNGLLSGESLEPGKILNGTNRLGDLIQPLVRSPVPVVRNIRRHDGEARGHEPLSPVKNGGMLLVLPTTMTDKDQRRRSGDVGSPQNSGNVTDREILHGEAFRGCLCGRSLRPCGGGSRPDR
ncbi:hypothetical protein GCM10009828_100600 [Actinoplanes couchii]